MGLRNILKKLFSCGFVVNPSIVYQMPIICFSKILPESHSNLLYAQWRIQGRGFRGLEPPFFGRSNAFEWEHVVGTPPFFVLGWEPPF